MGRIKCGGGDGGEPARSPPWLVFVMLAQWLVFQSSHCHEGMSLRLLPSRTQCMPSSARSTCPSSSAFRALNLPATVAMHRMVER
jgi:hypothetical protein